MGSINMAERIINSKCFIQEKHNYPKEYTELSLHAKKGLCPQEEAQH